MITPRSISRRRFLATGAALGAGAVLAGQRLAFGAGLTLRPPGSLPNPQLPIGVDTLPEIEHIIVVMMENHSFDNYLGMLRRGDGFPLKESGVALPTNPDGNGNLIRAFHMPSTCQLDSAPSQTWNASHISLSPSPDAHSNQGFVIASGPVAMGYWTEEDIPFYHGLARTFVVCDRWFGSCLAQTYPNRRFLMAGTAAGIVSTSGDALTAPSPPNGSIFDRLDAYGIEWRDYFSDLPSVAILAHLAGNYVDSFAPIAQYFVDAASGNLPAFAIVDPAFNGGESEENPDDIQAGEAFVARVVRAAMSGPGWAKTLLIWCYDEHGGYFDHVPPPLAVRPDDIPPDIDAPPDEPGAYDRYGFRVPAVVVSPFARPNYVSHVIHDHTSVLKLIETKWNLPALTFRDANADDLLDCLDLASPPAFLEPPDLPAPGSDSRPSSCTPGEPGEIPPPEAVSMAGPARRRLFRARASG
jgi:phospholipase C